MAVKVFTAALEGLDCTIVEVETDYRKGNAYFSIVGLADKSIQEARDRIPSAIRSAKATFVPMRIVMNLAPAEIHKSGPAYDLPLAVGYLLASDQIDFDTRGKIFIGELALDGRLRPVSGILPIADGIKKLGFTELFVPAENAAEAAIIHGLTVYPVETLRQLIKHCNKQELITAHPFVTPESYYNSVQKSAFDFSLVKGQNHAKRALEIAAAGGHNILLSGVPGSGKTMLSRCFSGILPSMSLPECLEVTRLYSITGKTSKKNPLISFRPFRTPHHTSSQVALVGGGTQIKPGEISLAHRGVLFLDEFPEFTTFALEALRQPLEDKVVTISRASGSITFPANFILVAAMNPCKCGYYGDTERECTCSPMEISRYQKRISGPILDRIDLTVHVPKVKNQELLKDYESESSATIKARVEAARKIQVERFHKEKIYSNSEMNQQDIKNHIVLDETCKTLLQKAMNALDLSARSYYRVLKVSRTIADLDSSEQISEKHIQEALSYRMSLGGNN